MTKFTAFVFKIWVSETKIFVFYIIFNTMVVHPNKSCPYIMDHIEIFQINDSITYWEHRIQPYSSICLAQSGLFELLPFLMLYAALNLQNFLIIIYIRTTPIQMNYHCIRDCLKTKNFGLAYPDFEYKCCKFGHYFEILQLNTG